jgi:4-diphosphocytidyl-2-C-methyl-D-erythritol kinase
MTTAEPGAADGRQGGAAELARAKVNLFLHVRGLRPDGMHLVESLAVFPDLGDVLRAEDGPGLGLALAGPFADALGTGGDNLVLRAAEALARAQAIEARAALTLEKRLPVASGIGGGSADAAAALRLLSRLWGVAVPEGLAPSLGADVPVCLSARAQWMAGVGERCTPCGPLPPFWIVLANPMVGVPTGAVFSALERRDNPAATPPPAAGLGRFAALADWLAAQRNDLEAPARALCPAVGAVLDALRDAPLARMSGSGATCFALHETQADALAQADALRARHPGWWVAAAPVGGAAGTPALDPADAAGATR